MSDSSEIKAADFVKQADKKLSSWGLFNPSKFEDAANLLVSAGNHYKIAKKWKEAGDCYKRVSDLYRDKMSNRIDTIHYMVEAAKVLKMVNPKEAVEMYKMCARYQMEDNKYAVAAKNWDEIAQLTGKDLADKKQSIEAYLKSAECYKSENSKVSAQSQLIKAADIMAEEGEYKRAISIYEDVAEEQSGSSAISFSVKNHLFKALLCQFGLDAQNNDVTDTEIKLSKYKEDNPRFAGTKEEELIGNLCSAFRDADVGRFTSLLAKYDQIYRLDTLATNILYKVKVAMTSVKDSDHVADQLK